MGSIVLVLVCATSCSTSSSSPTSDDTQKIVERIVSHCTDLDAPELGPGKLCIDNGFRMKTDDFTFANWGRSQQADANVTVQTLVDLFGQNNVCAPSTNDECVLRPSTMQKLEEWNTALSAGRCEGLAALSTRFFLKLDHPSSFRSDAASATDLQQNDPAIQKSIVYWWATQFLGEVADRASASRQRTPLDLVDDLIIGLANSVGYTLGMYFGSSGHAVTPFAVTRRDDQFVVHIYDNNFPGERREIFIDARTNTWTYPRAASRIDGTYVDWSGKVGTFELTPMSARKGPFRCPFCATSTKKSHTTLTLSSRDADSAGYLHLTSRSGSLSASPSGFTNTIADATYVVSKGRAGGLVTVTLPEGFDDFDVEVRRESSVVPAGDVVVGLHRAGEGIVQVSGNLAHSVVNDAQKAESLFSVRKDSTTIQAPTSNGARVSIAEGNTMSRRILAAGESLSVKRRSSTSIEISLKGSNGFDFGDVPIESDSTARTREITLDVTAGGKISTTEAFVLPIKIGTSSAVSFEPSPRPPVSTSSTSSSPPMARIPSIEISEPD